MTLNDLKVFFSQTNIKDSQSDDLQDFIVNKISEIMKQELPNFTQGKDDRSGDSLSTVFQPDYVYDKIEI